MKTNLLRNKEAEIEHPSCITGQLASFNDSLLSGLFQKNPNRDGGGERLDMEYPGVSRK